MVYTLNRCCCKYDISDGAKMIGFWQLFVLGLNLTVMLVWKNYPWMWMLLFPLLSVLTFVQMQKKDTLKHRRRFYIMMLLQLIFMNLGQIGFIVYDAIEDDRTQACEDEDRSDDFAYIVHCDPYMIATSVVIRASFLCLQFYFVCIVRQHWLNKRDGRGDATLKYHHTHVPEYLQAHQDFNEELNVEHYQRMAERGATLTKSLLLAQENDGELSYDGKQALLHSQEGAGRPQNCANTSHEARKPTSVASEQKQRWLETQETQDGFQYPPDYEAAPGSRPKMTLLTSEDGQGFVPPPTGLQGLTSAASLAAPTDNRPTGTSQRNPTEGSPDPPRAASAGNVREPSASDIEQQQTLAKVSSAVQAPSDSAVPKELQTQLNPTLGTASQSEDWI